MINILIVEDNKSYNDTFSTIIKKPEYNIFQAYSISDAKEILDKEKIEYVISDLNLEDGSAEDLLSHSFKYKKPKVLLLSSSSDTQRRNYLFDNGIIDYFSKETPLKILIKDIHEKIENLENNSSKNILIIDDSSFVRRSLEDILSNKKYVVYSVEDAIKGFDKLDETRFDLIYLDLEMPKMHGIDFLEEIKSNNLYKDIPVVIISSNTSSEMYSRALRHGATDFIKKPFLTEEILLKTELYILQSEHMKQIASQAKELQEYKRVLNESDIVSVTDSRGVIKEINDKFCEISGYKKDELIGKTHRLVNHPEMPKNEFKELWSKIKTHETYKGIIKNKKKDGSSYYVDATISPIIGVDGKIKEIIGIRHDVTDIMNPKKQLIADLEYMENPILVFLQLTNYDLLKEFYSETVMHTFEFEFEQVVLSYFPEHVSFKKVYNLGNGLFAFLKPREYELKKVNEYLQSVLDMFERIGISFQENNYDIDIALAFATQGENILDDVYIGIQEAIKNKTPIVYANGLHKMRQEKAREKLKSIQTIKDALNGTGQFTSYFQAIYDNKSGEIVKYESLIRLIDKNENVISPFFFLDIAKKTGYYTQITKTVIKNTEKALESTDKGIAINLSASDIEHEDIRDELIKLVSKKEFQGRVTFELLEDEDIKNFELVKNFILEAKKKGKVKIAIDDFGSGYSSYERLLAFQPDILKIDGSLIKNITKDASMRNVVESILVFAKNQNIKTVAEFVCEEDILKLITKLGVDYSQGFFLAEPKRLF